MHDVMITIPSYIPLLIPVLTVWWTHRRGARREYWLLMFSLFAVCLPLLVLAHYCRQAAILDSPDGIHTIQLPLAVAVASGLSAIPIKWKSVRNFVAIMIGEILLMPTWIA